ncbi:hypothetical protein HAX54_017098, partial [Datura stramonium]|nr:hypothetical protein [Datura stramonium]
MDILYTMIILSNTSNQTCHKIIQLLLADAKRVVVGGEREDRISELPGNVIDRILELLPVKDAAKTSILSKKWRYIWGMLPSLRLNKAFCYKLAVKSQPVFKEIVDTILLQHLGAIVKFYLDVSGVRMSSYAHIDRWMHYITRNGVKELYLHMSNNSTYKLPCYVLNCPTLTRLELSNCVFKPPNSFVGLRHLITIRLERITFVPTTEFCVINCPLLVNLALLDCRGAQYLNIIVSSRLEYLVGHKCPCLNLNLFMNCKKLRKLQLEIDEAVDNPNPKHDERSTLQKFLLSVAATLESLQMGLGYLELLTADTVPKGAPFTCLWELSLGIDFGKQSQISCALQLIKSCPNLSKLQIWVCATSDNVEQVLNYLERPTCLDGPLNKLKYLTINSYECSKIELLFVKLLVARAPTLVRMCIEQEKGINSSEEMNIAKDLMCFPRASPSIFRIRKLRTTNCTAYIM